MQKRCNSTANALELLLSCTNSSICYRTFFPSYAQNNHEHLYHTDVFSSLQISIDSLKLIKVQIIIMVFLQNSHWIFSYFIRRHLPIYIYFMTYCLRNMYHIISEFSTSCHASSTPYTVGIHQYWFPRFSGADSEDIMRIQCAIFQIIPFNVYSKTFLHLYCQKHLSYLTHCSLMSVNYIIDWIR